jgi:HK97 family phage major capsid protein
MLLGGGAAGFFVGENKAIPASRAAVSGTTLARKRVGGIMVVTKEAVEATGRLAAQAFDQDLQRAVRFALDEAFLDPSGDGSGPAPQSITYGANSQASSGDIATDLAALIENFHGDLASAAFIAHPNLAAQIATARDTGGTYLFVDLGPGGGSVFTEQAGK